MTQPAPKIARRTAGFTAHELLIVTALLGLLGTILVPAVLSQAENVRAVRCGQHMRQLATGILSWSADHQLEWPRSSHSAFAHNQRGWMRAILPYLDPSFEESMPVVRFRELQKKYFRCPSDNKRTSGSSYGINVFFELDPAFDDYEGSPRQWRSQPTVPSPTRTILLAEVPGTSDHVMAHFWQEGGQGFDVAIDRHRDTSNFAFADGSIARLPIQETFDPSQNLNLWNPDSE